MEEILKLIKSHKRFLELLNNKINQEQTESDEESRESLVSKK